MSEHQWKHGAVLIGTTRDGVYYPEPAHKRWFRCKRCGLEDWAHEEKDAGKNHSCNEIIMRRAID